MLKNIFVILILSVVSIQAQEFKKIDWSHLKGKMEAYDDPFKKLTGDQIYHLSIYARVMKMEKVSPKRVSDAMRKEAKDAQDTLKNEGVDIDYLLSQREHIKNMRSKAASSVNVDLNNTNISMSGFMLSLEYDQGMTRKFLLVPTVGACIHTPPPPINQIVFVETTNPIESGTRFKAVTISGRLLTERMSNNLFLVDGSSDIHSGYYMQTDNILEYKKK